MKQKLILFLVSMLCMATTALAQTKITGTVLSQEDGEPVIGATVMIQGDKKGTVTDINGNFTIDVPSGKKLSISYVGMKTTIVSPKANMVVKLASDGLLEDVVVTGMVKTDKRLFTGATAKIDATSAKIDGMADISRSLEGRAAGVSVQNVSGTFGTAPKIRVRGATSIFGSSKPLWVVDGVIMEDVTEVSADELSSGDAETLISSAIAGLNSDDIESFQILKDGSATSIYGARAMAGVIVITTKKGKTGSAFVNYTGEYTMRLKPSYNDFNIMNSQDQMSVYQELEQKGYLNYAEIANKSESGVYGKMYQLITEYDPTTGQFGLANTTAARNAYLRAAEMRNTNWFDRLFSNSVMHNHSVSVSSGTEKSQHYVSVSAMYDPGWYKRSEVERYTANLNSTFNINKKLEKQGSDYRISLTSPDCDTRPEFPGGDEARSEYYNNNKNLLCLGDPSNEATVSIYVDVVVEKDGTISNAKISRFHTNHEISEVRKHELKDAAIKFYSNMPKHVPAKKNGQPVRYEFTTGGDFKI